MKSRYRFKQTSYSINDQQSLSDSKVESLQKYLVSSSEKEEHNRKTVLFLD